MQKKLVFQAIHVVSPTFLIVVALVSSVQLLKLQLWEEFRWCNYVHIINR